MDKEKTEIEGQILLEKNTYIQLTVPQIKAFLRNLKKGKNVDFRYRQMIINVLVYRLYLYDSNITIIFNTQDKTFINKVPSIEQIEGLFLSKNDKIDIVKENSCGSLLGKCVLPYLYSGGNIWIN